MQQIYGGPQVAWQNFLIHGKINKEKNFQFFLIHPKFYVISAIFLIKAKLSLSRQNFFPRQNIPSLGAGSKFWGLSGSEDRVWG